MSWKKHFRVVPNQNTGPSLPNHSEEGGGSGTASKYSSYLPEVYAGHPNRIQRYYQYDDMDRDSDVNAALDTIADFCTQSEEQNEAPFTVDYNESANETEIKLLKTCLEKWVRINDFKSRLWYIVRSVIKNGDAFFIRDPETFEWLWADHYSILMVKVDEERGKVADEYLLKGLDLARQAKFATKKMDTSQFGVTPLGTTAAYGSKGGAGVTSGSFQMAGSHIDQRQGRPGQTNHVDDIQVIDADHMVHLSLSVGMDINWPFGASLLEPIFKTYKQKELLEDSIIIYRVQRAPERRIFYIDTGSMPPVRAKAHIQQVKNEIHQRRIPNRSGGGSSILDAAYNPLCLDMATQIPLLDGRTLSITQLAEEFNSGKENWIYSCDPVTGRVAPGNITWAGVTRQQAQVIRITLDTGETITCTPDHKIPVLGKGKVEAQYLTEQDSLISFNTRLKNIDRNSSNERTYQQVYDHESNSWEYTHRIVGDFFRKQGKHQEFTFLQENLGAVKNVVHHKDYNRYNNDPRNLQWMNKEDHVLFHVHQKQDYLNNLTENEKKISEFNGIISIEWLTEPMDVGTITVDGNERWHNFHTFATSAGIFVCNSIVEDYFFAMSSEGRGSKVETLAGGDNLGEIGDLSYFLKKMARGLRIPSSYLSLGEDDGNNVAYNDGKLGAALIQEFRFNKYCMRIQSLLAPIFDSEFKRFVKENGVMVDSNLFELKFNPPQNFTKYRQMELDAAQAAVYQMVAENKKLSERFKLKRFLNLTEEELIENETLWKEENASKLKKVTGNTPAESENAADLGSIGLRSGGGLDDFGMPDETAMPDDGSAGGAAPTDPAAGGAPAGGAPPAPPVAPPPMG